MLKDGFTRYTSEGDLKILVKYFTYKGLDKNSARERVVDFCKKSDPNYNEILWENKINNAFSNAKKEIIKIPFKIFITRNEIQKIMEINNYKYERVLFASLVLCKYSKKYYEYKNNKTTENYRVSLKLSEILKVANVQNMLKKDQTIMWNTLRDLGYANPNLSNRDCGLDIYYADENSETEIEIDNFENIMSLYPPRCKYCGGILEKSHNRNEMHKDCFKENRHKKEMERKRNWWKENRSNDVLAQLDSSG